MYHLTIRAVPSLYRNGGWDVVRDEPDGTMTIVAGGLQQQYAHDLAELLNNPIVDPADERVARYFADREE